MDELQSSLSVHEKKFRKTLMKKKIKRLVLGEGAEAPTKDVVEEEVASSTKQQLSATTATSWETSKMSVQMEAMELITQN